SRASSHNMSVSAFGQLFMGVSGSARFGALACLLQIRPVRLSVTVPSPLSVKRDAGHGISPECRTPSSPLPLQERGIPFESKQVVWLVSGSHTVPFAKETPGRASNPAIKNGTDFLNMRNLLYRFGPPSLDHHRECQT